ncbi:hypothetical protein FOXYSP1_03100 [Fusarium oxysporum f. sp. phaseoli]
MEKEVKIANHPHRHPHHGAWGFETGRELMRGQIDIQNSMSSLGLPTNSACVVVSVLLC